MSFLDQQPKIATQKDLESNWNGHADGKRFRCYLCGHKFKIGDRWRFVLSNRFGNFLTCEECDGEDVIEKWTKANLELETRFWWMVQRLEDAVYYK